MKPWICMVKLKPYILGEQEQVDSSPSLPSLWGILFASHWYLFTGPLVADPAFPWMLFRLAPWLSWDSLVLLPTSQWVPRETHTDTEKPRVTRNIKLPQPTSEPQHSCSPGSRSFHSAPHLTRWLLHRAAGQSSPQFLLQVCLPVEGATLHPDTCRPVSLLLDPKRAYQVPPCSLWTSHLVLRDRSAAAPPLWSRCSSDLVTF